MKSLRKLAVMVGVLALCACTTGTGGQGSDTGSTTGTGSTAGGSTGGTTGGAEGTTGGAGNTTGTGSTAGGTEGTTGSGGSGTDSAANCSNVRCAACPEGQHPKLTPPDCCKCVPN